MVKKYVPRSRQEETLFDGNLQMQKTLRKLPDCYVKPVLRQPKAALNPLKA
jgi:hypothetical protein